MPDWILWGTNFLFPFYETCVQSQWDIKFWDQLKTQTLGVRVQFSLGWNTCLLFNTDVVNFVWKNDEGEEGSIVLLIFVFWRCLNRRWVRVGGVGQKVVFRAAEIATFSSGDFNRSNKHHAYWRVITAGYLYWCFRSLYLGNL